jgi:hypothetical protein
MKLRRCQIQNYRSVVDSAVFGIEEGVTVLVGRNEQGKSNCLKAIASFNVTKARTYSPSDLPSHLRVPLESEPGTEIPIVSLWFALEPDDTEELAPHLPQLKDCEWLKATKYYEGNYRYWTLNADGEEQGIDLAAPDIAPLVEVGATAKAYAGHSPCMKEASSMSDALLSRSVPLRCQKGIISSPLRFRSPVY